MSTTLDAPEREVIIRRLAGERDRSRFLWWSVAGLAALILYAWASGDFSFDDFLSDRRMANVQRFVRELRPHPLHDRAWDWGIALEWSRDLLATRGWRAAAVTLAISMAAIVLASLGAALLTLPATRTFAAPEPYGPHARAPSRARRLAWGAVVLATRALLIFLRAVPEYVWAFLLIAMVGPNPWAAVLALALHNAGILAKLNAEVVENLPSASLSALRALGAGRRQIAMAGIAPAMAPRFTLFFFYRWETCVREATVLGMLGIVSIGFFVQDARARQYYDAMFALILVGSAIVLIGDFLSAAARKAIRESS